MSAADTSLEQSSPASPHAVKSTIAKVTRLVTGIAGLYSSATTALLGGSSVTEANISTITDAIILQRYVEMSGEMRRGITILKMCGSRHEKNIREFSIDSQGMHIDQPFCSASGIISGNFGQIAVNEVLVASDLTPPKVDDFPT